MAIDKTERANKYIIEVPATVQFIVEASHPNHARLRLLKAVRENTYQVQGVDIPYRPTKIGIDSNIEIVETIDAYEIKREIVTFATLSEIATELRNRIPEQYRKHISVKVTRGE